MTRTLLVVDDDAALARQLKWAFSDFEVLLAAERATAIDLVRKAHPPVVLLDLGLPPDPHGPTEGLATLEQVLSIAPTTKIIMVSGQTEREYAVRAVGRGAYDFYEKPIDFDALSLIVQRAYRVYELEEENRRLNTTPNASPLPNLLTANAAMITVCEQARRFAGSKVAVLLLGESGTGKELFAKGVHVLSGRAEGPFIAINCAAIPDNLLESELFGHEKGSFTGALKQQVGKIELASGGTLFLDEIGDLPLGLQAKLLRFLQERSIERVGGRKSIPVDIRVVSATNRNLAQLIAQDEFREDLYFRLAEAVIEIPPLRQRPEDIFLLAHHFLSTQAQAEGRLVQSFAPDALTALSSYGWPGNVRELENRVKRAVVAATGKQVTLEDLGLPIGEGALTGSTLKESRERADRAAIVRALVEAKGNISKASRILDISRPTLYQLLREYDIHY